MNELRSKDPLEVVPIVFDFGPSLNAGDGLTGTVSVTVTVHEGADGSPSALLSGAATVSGDKVTQKVTGGVAGVSYLVRVSAATTQGLTYVLGAILPVRLAGTD